MEDLKLILSIAATGLGLLITTLTFLTKFIKSVKAKRVAENLVKIGNAVLPFIEQAERFVNYSGEEKKEYVMTKANQYALKNKMPFDAETVSRKIEELIELTKQVNVDNKIYETKLCALIDAK